MSEQEIMKTIEDLSHSQGFYGRILRYLQECDSDTYRQIMDVLVAQHFKEPLDLVLYLES